MLLVQPIYLVTDVLKLSLLMFGVLDFKKQIKAWNIAFFAVSAAVVGLLEYLRVNEDLYMVISVILAVAVVAACLRVKKQALFVVLFYLAFSVVDVICAGIVYGVLNRSVIGFGSTPVLNILINLISLVVVAIAAVICVYARTQKKQSAGLVLSGRETTRNLWVIVLGLVALVVYIAPIQLISLSESSRARMQGLLGVSLSAVLFFGISISSLVNQQRKEAYRRQNETYETLLEQQTAYYTALMERETELRRFRHDVNSHMRMIGGLLDENKVSEAQTYVRDMAGIVARASEGVRTGNQILDIVVNQEWSGHADVKLVWRGTVPGKLKMADIDVCMLFSNLFKNSIEAVEEMIAAETIDPAHPAETQSVQASVRLMGTALYFTISNPVGGVVRFKQGRPVTSKNDTRLHGFGLMNIERVSEKHNGTVEYRVEDGRFVAEVMLMDVVQTEAAAV